MPIVTTTNPDGSTHTVSTDAAGNVLWQSRTPDSVSSAQLTNQATIEAQAAAALTANAQDLTQDQTIMTQAAAITAGSLTTNALVIAAVVKLAQAVSILAQNDTNTKKELNALIRLALADFDGTS